MANTVCTPLLKLLILFILTSIPIPSLSCPDYQKQALLHFKTILITTINSTYFQPVLLKSWNSTSDCCTWELVTCARTKTVTELHLDGLVVPLPDINDPVPVFSDILSPLFRIRSLKKLDISHNYLHGEIPGDEFVNLTELVHLDMHDNYFNGSIPSQLFLLTNLYYLDLNNNMLKGGLAHELFDLMSLQYLDIGENNLKGCLSPEVGKLLNLETLILFANFFSGNIPEEIGNLTKLIEFSLKENFFSGEIPSSITNLILQLGMNKFTGPFPLTMQNLSKLKSLALQDNMFTGEIPTWLFNITTLIVFSSGRSGLIWNKKAMIVPRCNLRELSMPSSNISGQIPKWISTQNELIWLDLSKNKLEGRFPNFLTYGKLEIINLSENNLMGPIPPRLFESVYIRFLDLSQNKFTGELSVNIGKAKRLNFLRLSKNNFSGQIPQSISEIDNLRNLSDFQIPYAEDDLIYLDLSHNSFSGQIPMYFPKGIKFLYLGGNKFCGNLPWNLTKLANLKILDIHGNNITGNLHETLPHIPTLEVFVLRNNSLEGYIPGNVSNLSSLRILDLSHNHLTGSVPQEMANLLGMKETFNKSTPFNTIYNALLYSYNLYSRDWDLIVNWKGCWQDLAVRNYGTHSLLDLSHNNIYGKIPPSLGKLRSLKLLNISYNKISGHIPLSFGDLENIESLDLSHNEISGSIPESLVKLKQLTILDVSNNKLIGKIPVGGQMNSMDQLDYYENNTGLCGMQIRVICPHDIQPVEGTNDEDDKQSWFLWEVTFVGFPVGFFSSILIMGYFLDFRGLFNIW